MTLLAEAEIGPEGGMLASTARGLTMQVPAGALTSPTTLRLYALDLPAAGKADLLPADPWLVPTRRFRIEPVDLALSQPAWLTIHAPAADVPFVATAFDIGLYRRDGSGWTTLDLDAPNAAFDVFPAEPRSAGKTSKLGEIALRLHPPYVDAPTIHQIGTGSAVSTKDGPVVAVGVGGILARRALAQRRHGQRGRARPARRGQRWRRACLRQRLVPRRGRSRRRLVLRRQLRWPNERAGALRVADPQSGAARPRQGRPAQLPFEAS